MNNRLVDGLLTDELLASVGGAEKASWIKGSTEYLSGMSSDISE